MEIEHFLSMAKSFDLLCIVRDKTKLIMGKFTFGPSEEGVTYMGSTLVYKDTVLHTPESECMELLESINLTILFTSRSSIL